MWRSDTAPGDVVAFDLHTFHASFGGRDRLAWNIEYLTVPDDDESKQKVVSVMVDGFEQSFRGFDRDRYPTWGDWLSSANAHPRRAPVIERLRRSGSSTSGARSRDGELRRVRGYVLSGKR